MEGKYLVTSDMWFTAPDGKDYKAVWGDVKVVKTIDVWGFEPNRPSQNWFLQIGTEEHNVLVAGCQIHYAIKCPVKPNSSSVTSDYGEGEKTTDCKIYFPHDYSTKSDDDDNEPIFPKDRVKNVGIGFKNIFKEDNGKD